MLNVCNENGLCLAENSCFCYSTYEGDSNCSTRSYNYRKIFTLGYNDKGQLGIGNFSPFEWDPQLITSENYLIPSSGSDHIFFLTVDGKMLGVGDNTNGQLGFGSSGFVNVITEIIGSNVKKVCAMENGGAILTKLGEVLITDNYGFSVVSDTQNLLNGVNIIQIVCDENSVYIIPENKLKLFSYGLNPLSSQANDVEELFFSTSINSNSLNCDKYQCLMEKEESSRFYTWGADFILTELDPSVIEFVGTKTGSWNTAFPEHLLLLADYLLTNGVSDKEIQSSMDFSVVLSKYGVDIVGTLGNGSSTGVGSINRVRNDDITTPTFAGKQISHASLLKNGLVLTEVYICQDGNWDNSPGSCNGEGICTGEYCLCSDIFDVEYFGYECDNRTISDDTSDTIPDDTSDTIPDDDTSDTIPDDDTSDTIPDDDTSDTSLDDTSDSITDDTDDGIVEGDSTTVVVVLVVVIIILIILVILIIAIFTIIITILWFYFKKKSKQKSNILENSIELEENSSNISKTGKLEKEQPKEEEKEPDDS